MRRRLLFALLCALALPAWSALPFPLASAHVLVVDDATGQPLMEKDAEASVPMASLTKLLTAMVVMDAGQDPGELLVVTDDDLDRLKHTRRGLPVGTVLSRAQMLDLALQTSDNRAASALARHYPGGMDAFLLAAARKARELGLRHTVIVEPTGLSPQNLSSAADMAAVLQAASAYPLIESTTRAATQTLLLQGKLRTVHNTNALVGRDGWDILLSKTGFTNEAGRCLAMRVREAGRVVRVVLLGGFDPGARNADALNIRRFLRGEPAVGLQAKAVDPVTPRASTVAVKLPLGKPRRPARAANVA
jgi:D-alanyl-D-alanine carboxypeptidase/D-alanyl-D-alanine endopeptidase (penicillin-binding protein 7)